MKQTQFKKMLIQNAPFAFMILTLIALLIKIKRLTKHKKIEKQNPERGVRYSTSMADHI